MRVFWAALALLLGACAGQNVGLDAQQRIQEIIVNDDGTIRFGAVSISDRLELRRAFRSLAQQMPQNLILVRGDEGRNLNDVRVVATDAGMKNVMMTSLGAVCERDRIQAVATPNSGPWIIVTTAGQSFEILGQDFIDPRRWRPQQSLLRCPNWQGNNQYFDLLNIDRGETLTTLRKDARAIID